MPARGAYDRETIDAILDEALVAHLGIAIDGQPYVIPTLHARIGDTLYLHGSAGSRTLRALAAGTLACLTVTLLDGLVLARSARHHSVNYRSVVVLGQATPVTDSQERLAALHAFMERIVPGRFREVRAPTEADARVTGVLSMSLVEASANVRTGPPLDDEQDYSLDVWAGVVPLRMRAGPPIPDPRLASDIKPTATIESWLREHA
jgi:nitroimidazol reductase NimA-like FMN-containing flavoprotein (pyridoxamine 5'-phosphate oxidase superfamily)